MNASPRPLTFSAVDGLGFAVASGNFDAAERSAPFAPDRLGPLLELFDLVSGGQLPPPRGGRWVTEAGPASLIDALEGDHETWLVPDGHRMGFIRSLRKQPDGDNRFTAFLMTAQRAAREVTSLPGTTPGQLVAAMQEFESNIHEHSEAPATGCLAFCATPEIFEFAVLDHGIGVLESLHRCTSFAELSDHGKALQAALTDGTSRLGPGSNHGHGFRPMFLGLANLRGSLRFRTGDYALTMDGTSPTLATAQLAQKPYLKGFFASISCSRH